MNYHLHLYLTPFYLDTPPNLRCLYPFGTLRDWYKKMYDPATGEMGLKKDYVGTLIIVQYNRAGDIYRKLTLLDTFPATNPTGLDAGDYSSPDAQTIEMAFKCDHWEEELA